MSVSFFRQHSAVIVIALVLGLFTGGVLTFGGQNIPGFSGIYRQVLDDQLYYVTRAHEVTDGHSFLSNPYLSEHKNTEPMQFWLPDYLLATPLGFFGISVEQGYLAYSFIFPVVLFLLTYAIVFLLTRFRLFSLLTTSFLHIGLFLITFARIPSPQFNFVFFEILLLSLLLYFDSKKLRYAILTALSFGLLFYLYPYFWTFVAATLGIFLVFGFFSRTDIQIRTVLAIFLGGFILGSQYFWSLIEASRLSFYTETVERVGMVHTHFPSGFSIVAFALLTLSVFAWALWKRILRIDAISLLFLSGVFASIVAVNQHVITGQNLEFSSHYFLPSIYWFVLTVAYIVSRFVITYDSKWIRNITLCILGVIVVISIVQQSITFTRLAFSYTPTDVSTQRYAPVFDWLKMHTKKDDVVFANPLLSQYIPAYTSNNIYSSGYAILFFLSNTEAEERYIINHYWDNFTPEYIAANERSIFGAGYLDEYAHNQSKNTLRKVLRLPSVSYERIPASAIARVMVEAKAIQAESFQGAIEHYRADYIVWDMSLDPVWKLERYPFLETLYQSGDVVVYKVN